MNGGDSIGVRGSMSMSGEDRREQEAGRREKQDAYGRVSFGDRADYGLSGTRGATSLEGRLNGNYVGNTVRELEAASAVSGSINRTHGFASDTRGPRRCWLFNGKERLVVVPMPLIFQSSVEILPRLLSGANLLGGNNEFDFLPSQYQFNDRVPERSFSSDKRRIRWLVYARTPNCVLLWGKDTSFGAELDLAKVFPIPLEVMNAP
ncbi:hypothetical protein FB451DRAFT_1169183 [Mycena latifolia]|nr:hypothetical protein FB451DRAFT_1187735 [Mycena latifolia]KAJ7485968.1 hypothetical protein FB451DRAFT_1169183 [Mycena latifolia]